MGLPGLPVAAPSSCSCAGALLNNQPPSGAFWSIQRLGWSSSGRKRQTHQLCLGRRSSRAGRRKVRSVFELLNFCLHFGSLSQGEEVWGCMSMCPQGETFLHFSSRKDLGLGAWRSKDFFLGPAGIGLGMFDLGARQGNELVCKKSLGCFRFLLILENMD